MRHTGSRGSARRGSAESDTVRELESTVRRIGLVLVRLLDFAQRSLAEQDRQAEAELVRDELKPIADWLMHVELGKETR